VNTSPDHDHPHHGEEPSHAPGHRENPWAGQGAVLLDIGGDIGALVVEMPAEMVDVEIEIRPTEGGAAAPGHHPHVAVVARRVGTGTVPSLVYPELRTGSYELYEKGSDRVEMTAHVEGGSVTHETWPAPASKGHAEGRRSG
jgi:hypothetical protein